MNNAIWLIAALPEWYFSSLLNPFAAGPLSLVPAAGVIALIAGGVWSIRLRRKGLLLFVMPFALSEILVGFAGFYRGAVNGATSSPILLSFLAIILIIAIALVWRMKGARLPALLLTVFSITYAMFAAFVAGMSFSDSWL